MGDFNLLLATITPILTSVISYYLGFRKSKADTESVYLDNVNKATDSLKEIYLQMEERYKIEIAALKKRCENLENEIKDLTKKI